MSKQLLRSGTSIGAMIREAEFAESKADFIHKMAVALKETNETLYWLELMHHAKLLQYDAYVSIHTDAHELLKLLISIVKSSKEKVM